MSESDTNNPTTKQYSGDVTLDGSHNTPVRLDGEEKCEDVYLLSNSVEGDLRIENAEYVYTQQPTSDDATIDTVETDVKGDPRFEDGYIENVAGDAILANVQDVFVPHDAVEGSLEVAGAENIFTDADTTPDDLTDFDVQTSGWKRSKHASTVRNGLYVTGGKADVTVDDIEDGAELYIVGFDHDITIEGSNADVDIHIVGRDNNIHFGPYVNYELVSETGFDNQITQDEFPVSDLIETPKEDAFPLFGRSKVTWQEPAPEKNRCPNCGERTDAIIERHNMDAFFLFGSAVKEYDPDSHSYECDSCSFNGGADVNLSDDEFKSAVR